MDGLQGLLEAFTGSGIEEGLRLAYAAQRFMPASLVVGTAAVLAGLLGAAAIKRVRSTRSPTAGRAGSVPWVLGMALLALWLAVSPASAEVLCRKRQSVRLVLRAETCRPREHVVLPSELGIEQGETCVEAIGLAWRDVDALRAHFESARDLAARMEEQPWSGGEIWLAIEAVAIEQTLASLERRMDELGTPDVHTTIAHLWQLVTEEWATPLAACIEALEILPALEAALPTPPAA